MATEIERKFLVKDDGWRQGVHRSRQLRQGYLVSDEVRSVRIRISDDSAHLNIKSGTLGVSRSEFEYSIPLEDARQLLQLCGNLLEKTRHLVKVGDHVWEVDVFEGANEGLVVAEVELSDPDEPFEMPPWAGEDVSHDARYYNSCLVEHPYRDWQD